MDSQIQPSLIGSMKSALEKILRMRFAVPVLILSLIVLAIFSEVYYFRTKAILTQGIQLTDARIGAASLLQMITDAETAQRGYLLTSNPAYIDTLREAQREYNGDSALLDFINGLGPSGPDAVKNIRALVSTKFADLDTTIAMAQAGNHVQAIAWVQTGEGKRLMDQLRDMFESKLGEAALQQQDLRDQLYAGMWFSRIAILVLALILAVGLYIHMHQLRIVERERASYRQILENEVAVKSAGIRTLAASLETAREEEKSHLARELHDELGGILTAAKLTTARIRNKLSSDAKALELVDSINHCLNEGVALKRRIIENLRPSALDMLGLDVAIENLCSATAQQLGISVVAHVEKIQINPNTELVIFRIVQEALTNIAKYSQATEVSVQIEKMGTDTVLKINDNGVGFDLNIPTAGHHGLAGMQFRVESHGGSFTITTAPDKGVAIFAKLPASQTAPDASTANTPYLAA